LCGGGNRKAPKKRGVGEVKIVNAEAEVIPLLSILVSS